MLNGKYISKWEKLSFLIWSFIYDVTILEIMGGQMILKQHYNPKLKYNKPVYKQFGHFFVENYKNTLSVRNISLA